MPHIRQPDMFSQIDSPVVTQQLFCIKSSPVERITLAYSTWKESVATETGCVKLNRRSPTPTETQGPGGASRTRVSGLRVASERDLGRPAPSWLYTNIHSGVWGNVLET